MEATLTSSQDQTGITTKLIILTNQLKSSWRDALSPGTYRRNRITTSTRVGIAEKQRAGWVPQAAAEVLEGYFSGCGGVPP